tara:strand:+ start:627 stop:1340 length:714 start_codon:yes stop_codon:yes gene_type:complete
VKLFKFVASSGLLSRRKSQESIKSALITVNNIVELDPFVDIDPEKDIVRLDEQKIKFRRECETIVLHKPKGFICSRSDEFNRKTIFDLIPKKSTLNYIGRLDKNTTGIILLTNDGNLSQFLTHPKNKVPKEYIAETTAQIQESQVKKIKKCIFIGSGEKGRAEILSQKKVKNTFHIKMILRQGKKNEIRRIFKFSNIKLFSLKRVKFGNIALGDLKEGFWRELTKKEKEYFRKVRLK